MSERAIRAEQLDAWLEARALDRRIARLLGRPVKPTPRRLYVDTPTRRAPATKRTAKTPSAEELDRKLHPKAPLKRVFGQVLGVR